MWGSGYDKRTVLRATPATNVITGIGLGSRAVVLAAFDRGIFGENFPRYKSARREKGPHGLSGGTSGEIISIRIPAH